MSYERLWRLPLIGDNRFGVDIVPRLCASIGNIYTYGETGVLLRIGRGLGADYGPVRIRPALSATDYFDAEDLDKRAGLFFAGTQGRVVDRNIFLGLGGNSFRTSPSVSKKNLVGDAQAGFSVLWSKLLRLDISVALCTEEFHGQRTPDDICAAALSLPGSIRPEHARVCILNLPSPIDQQHEAPPSGHAIGIVGSSVVTLGIFL